MCKNAQFYLYFKKLNNVFSKDKTASSLNHVITQDLLHIYKIYKYNPKTTSVKTNKTFTSQTPKYKSTCAGYIYVRYYHITGSKAWIFLTQPSFTMQQSSSRKVYALQRKCPRKLQMYYRYLLLSFSPLKKHFFSVEFNKIPGITSITVWLITLLPFLIHVLRYNVLSHSVSVPQTYESDRRNKSDCFTMNWVVPILSKLGQNCSYIN